MDSEKKQRIYKTIMLVVITMFVTCMVTAVFMYNFLQNSSGVKYATFGGANSELTSSINIIRSMIDKYYLGDIDEEKLIEGAIKGYVEGLGDPYTEYFPKEEMEEYTEGALGHYCGIGIYMINDTKKNAIMVLAPIEGGPAEAAGLLPGDIITKVDGTAYTGEQINEASNKIKAGESGTTVKLEILRDNKTLEIEVKREEVKVNHIKSEILENNIGYVKISTFDEGCADEFKSKIEELNQKGMKSLIIDLRNNGGGIVGEATDIADYLLPKGEDILITVDKNGKEEITKSEHDPIVKDDVKVVVLVNEYTASASEILAGALKDYQRAKIIGENTYGKGVIQVLKQFTDGSGIKMTVNEYYTPKRNKINKEGIAPDIEVELPEEEQDKLSVEREKDTQLQKAIEELK